MNITNRDAQVRHRRNSLFIFFSTLAAFLTLFYLALIRPFSAGFDLISIGRGEGIQINNLTKNTDGSIRNQLLGLNVLVLDGEFQGAKGHSAALSQIDGIDRPFILELNMSHGDETALIIGFASPDPATSGYNLEQGITAQARGDYFISENLSVNVKDRKIHSTGQTRMRVGGNQIASESGFSADEEGNFDLY